MARRFYREGAGEGHVDEPGAGAAVREQLHADMYAGAAKKEVPGGGGQLHLRAEEDQLRKISAEVLRVVQRGWEEKEFKLKRSSNYCFVKRRRRKAGQELIGEKCEPGLFQEREHEQESHERREEGGGDQLSGPDQPILRVARRVEQGTIRSQNFTCIFVGNNLRQTTC